MEAACGSAGRLVWNAASTIGRKGITLAAVGAVECRIVLRLLAFFGGLERGSATAGTGGVGIEDLKPPVGQFVGKINGAAFQKVEGIVGDNESGPVQIDDFVAILRSRDPHGVGQAGTSAAFHPQTKTRSFWGIFGGEEAGKLTGSFVGHGDHL